MKDRQCSLFSRLFFGVALIMLTIAVWEWVLQLFGWTLSWMPYVPGRLFEFAGILMIFVIAVLLRQIRDALKKPPA